MPRHLQNDVITKGENVNPPPLRVAKRRDAEQWKNFDKEMVPAKQIDGVKNEFYENEGKDLVESMKAGPNDVQVWAALPVHQKVATLYISGVNLHQLIES